MRLRLGATRLCGALVGGTPGVEDEELQGTPQTADYDSSGIQYLLDCVPKNKGIRKDEKSITISESSPTYVRRLTVRLS